MIHNIKKLIAHYLEDKQKRKDVNGEEKNRFQGIEQVQLKSEKAQEQREYTSMKIHRDERG